MEVKLPTVVRLTTSLLVPGYIKYSQCDASNSFKKNVIYVIDNVERVLPNSLEIVNYNRIVDVVNIGLFKLGTLSYVLLRNDQKEVMNKIIRDSLASLYEVIGEKAVTRYLQRLPIGELA